MRSGVQDYHGLLEPEVVDDLKWEAAAAAGVGRMDYPTDRGLRSVAAEVEATKANAGVDRLDAVIYRTVVRLGHQTAVDQEAAAVRMDCHS